jgi:hypothetical protein
MEFLKSCSKCGLDKSFDSFHKGNSLHGLKSQCIICCKRHYNPEKARNARRRYQNNNRERVRAFNLAYDKEHRAERTATESFRRAKKLNATPKWLTKEHKDQIRAIYQQRKELSISSGIMYHVDHIVPLVSDFVCGLHVPWNLQLLPSGENLKKSNKVV